MFLLKNDFFFFQSKSLLSLFFEFNTFFPRCLNIVRTRPNFDIFLIFFSIFIWKWKSGCLLFDRNSINLILSRTQVFILPIIDLFGSLRNGHSFRCIIYQGVIFRCFLYQFFTDYIVISIGFMSSWFWKGICGYLCL